MDANRRNLFKDRSWMNYNSASDRRKPEYENGVNTFLDFAFSKAGSNDKIRCPCVNCYLGSYHDRKIVFYHLLSRGIAKDYNPWTQHGEDETEDEPIHYETPVAIAHEEHVFTPRVENNVRSSRQEKFNSGDIHHGVKENRAIHMESDENRSSPIIPPNVWNYVNAIGISKMGGFVHQKDSDDDDDNGDLDVSIGEDNNFTGVDNCDSSPIQSCDAADIVATEAEHVVQAPNSGNGKLSDKRRRGRPCGSKSKKKLERSIERVKVELPAKLGRVVGSNALQFVQEGTRLLKETLPVNVAKWRDLNPNDVSKLLEKVKNRFIFPNESHVDTALLWQFKQWYRNWRSDLRRSYFNKYNTYDEQLAHRPHFITEKHWKWLVDYWSSEKFKNISAINSRIRSNANGFACVGPISIARHAYELEMNKSNPDSGQIPNYLKLYEKQKRRIDKTWITKEAEEGYEKLVKLHQKQVEEHGVDNLSPSEAYAKTFTKAKSINLLGLGENPIAIDGSSNKRRQTGCNDQRIIDASVRARRPQIESARKSDYDEEEEERTGQEHSDQDTGGGAHQGEDYDDDDDNGDPDVSIGEDNNFAGVDNCDSSPIQSCGDADIVATEAEQVAADSGNGKRRRGRPRGSKSEKKLEKSTEQVKVKLPAKQGFVHEKTNQSNKDSDHTPIYLILYEKKKRNIDKTWITKEAEEGYNKLVELHQEQVKEHGLDNLSPFEAYAKVFTRAQCKILLGLGENPIALEGSSFKRRRTGCSDQRTIDASVSARPVELEPAQKSDGDDDEEEEERTGKAILTDKCVLNCANKFETEPAQKSDDEEEERTGGGHCDRQLRSKTRKQIRKTRQGVASSSATKTRQRVASSSATKS